MRIQKGVSHNFIRTHLDTFPINYDSLHGEVHPDGVPMPLNISAGFEPVYNTRLPDATVADNNYFEQKVERIFRHVTSGSHGIRQGPEITEKFHGNQIESYVPKYIWEEDIFTGQKSDVSFIL